MACGRRRRSLSLKHKHDIYVAVHNRGQSVSVIANSYGKSLSTISDIVRNGPYDSIVDQKRYKIDVCMDLMESETKRMILSLREKSHSISSRVREHTSFGSNFSLLFSQYKSSPLLHEIKYWVTNLYCTRRRNCKILWLLESGCVILWNDMALFRKFFMERLAIQ